MIVKSLYKNDVFEWIDIQDMKYENIFKNVTYQVM